MKSHNKGGDSFMLKILRALIGVIVEVTLLIVITIMDVIERKKERNHDTAPK